MVGMSTVPLRNGKKVMWRGKTQGEVGSKALRGKRGCVCESLRTNEGFYIAGRGSTEDRRNVSVEG